MQHAYLPAMPEDETAQVREALLAARGRGDENPVMYCKSVHREISGHEMNVQCKVL